MKCYSCNNRAQVLEVRERDSGGARRRYECKACGFRFTTMETLSAVDAWGGDRRSKEFKEATKAEIAQAGLRLYQAHVKEQANA